MSLVGKVTQEAESNGKASSFFLRSIFVERQAQYIAPHLVIVLTAASTSISEVSKPLGLR